MIRAVLIDFDDTLCQTEAAGFALENEALRLMGRPLQSREVHRRTWGQPLLEVMAIRSPGVDIDEFMATIQKLVPEWVQAGKYDAVPEENLQALDALLMAGKEVYMVTSREAQVMHHMLADDHVLSERIHAFYYRDVMQYHKPDPRCFDIVLRTHELIREECVYVGDTQGDAKAAKGAGFTFIANLESGLRNRKDFAGLGVDLFVNRFSDVPKAVARLEARNTSKLQLA